jgi:hypothetical protein
LEVFPRWAQTWCEQLAHELQLSLDLPAMGLLGVTAGAVGNALVEGVIAAVFPGCAVALARGPSTCLLLWRISCEGVRSSCC